MRISVVIRTRDEAPRLRLTLASLERQACHEVAVADDGSADDTPAVLEAAARALPLRVIRHTAPLGRAAASNAGARIATGDLLLFLDGDTLAGPDMVSAHVALHRGKPDIIGRGETWHLRCTRFLADPEGGIGWPDDDGRAARLPPAERDAMRVTRGQVRDAFEAIARRAGPGIYPGAVPRRIHDAEIRALAGATAGDRSWAAASGSNLSVRRDAFLAVGGFDPEIDINEHRELAYRLCRAGARVMLAEGARSYHLTHRSGWRDPLAERGWESRFRSAHPEAPIDALTHYWAALSSDAPVPAFFG